MIGMLIMGKGSASFNLDAVKKKIEKIEVLED